MLLLSNREEKGPTYVRPRSVSALRISLRMAGRRWVEGTGTSLASAMLRIVLRRILPERVLGRRATIFASLKEPLRGSVDATGRRSSLELASIALHV